MTQQKVLLLHGWDWRKYPAFAPDHQWQNRQEFLDKLAQQYDVSFPSLPGFGRDDKDMTGSWTLDDYASWLHQKMTSEHFDAIVGYSFGCAVATHWCYQFPSERVALVLISPAISRAYRKPPHKMLTDLSKALKRFGFTKLTHFFRSLYLNYRVKNPYTIHATPFLRRTYSNTVGVDLSEELAELIDQHHSIQCVFGSNDMATPPELLFARVPNSRTISHVIPEGTHNIGATHADEVIAVINRFLDH